MTWADSYEFDEPFLDLRDGSESAEALVDELLRELTAGHPLHGRELRVIARSLVSDDVVVVADDEVALVHLTWTPRKAERPPLPSTQVLATVEDLEALDLEPAADEA